MSFFKKKSDGKNTFTLKGINPSGIDKKFNIGFDDDIIFEDEDTKKTSIEKLGISSLSKEPLLTIVVKEKTKLQTFISLFDIVKKTRLPLKTDIPCFGCRRRFTTPPLGVPIEYHPAIYISKNDSTKIKRITRTESNNGKSKYSDSIDEQNDFFEELSIKKDKVWSILHMFVHDTVANHHRYVF